MLELKLPAFIRVADAVLLFLGSTYVVNHWIGMIGYKSADCTEILTGGAVRDVFRVVMSGVTSRYLIFDTRSSVMKCVDVLNHSDSLLFTASDSSKTSSLPPHLCYTIFCNG